ncbi:helix-turn-helix transcriptional regulator [Lactiplantibacillus mudanjiangensis]|uniref:Transcriptional regulator [Lactobacillus plantarum] n=1 Tax=Lactiplantibacillus mudanjiangensis TaxID=1296538 RepID=A0A660E961_9LACO|nr:helix-turn-helix transcriptional regulator [Lactiplantibacillus mudanjiangensis]VDG23708.1 transcriptional regulator [Lactobacillus plantarum] [Lactiplantibacillus mudanjiangensis]VDG29619.1 transcriptional regulator [Lactobacillus plantarum] [Lactiplantibacillus mudanjiangensis]
MLNRLRKMRIKSGLTQQELADLINSNQRTISKWERGKSTPPAAVMQYFEEYFKEPKEHIFFEAFNYKMLLKSKFKQH